MNELNLNRFTVYKDKLDLLTKLLNTKPEVVVDFLVEVGLKMLLESETILKKEFKEYLKRIPGKDDKI